MKSIIFLSSCTIDWNDEKDKKITELEKQVQELKNGKELELQKFELEKQRYEEGKEKDIQEREDKLKKECINNKKIFLERITDTMNKCTNQECVDSITSDARFQIPINYISNCVTKKLDGTWQGD